MSVLIFISIETALLSYDNLPLYSCVALPKHTKQKPNKSASENQTPSYPKGLLLSDGAVLSYHHWTNRRTLNYSRDLSLEAFAAAQFNVNEISSGRQLYQGVQVLTLPMKHWKPSYIDTAVCPRKFHYNRVICQMQGCQKCRNQTFFFLSFLVSLAFGVIIHPLLTCVKRYVMVR